MYKKVSLIPIFILIFILNGCGNTTSEQSCQYQLEYSLDKAATAAEFQAVVTLADGACDGKVSSGDKYMTKAAAYMGIAGISIAGIAGDIVGGGDIMAIVSAKVTGSTAMQNISKAVDQYNLIIGTNNCTSVKNSSTADANLKSACTLNGFAQPILAVSTISVIAGDSVTYNGVVVTAMSALLNPSSVGIVDGNATQFDVDGDGMFDNTQASGMAISYANNGQTAFGTNYITPLGNVSFTSPALGPYASIKSTIVAKSPMTTNTLNYHLVDSTSKSTITTSGYCSTTFVACDTPNGTSCLPCPVVNSDGTTSTSTEGVLDLVNSSDDPALAGIADTIDCNPDDGLGVTGAELAYYMTNGSCEGY